MFGNFTFNLLQSPPRTLIILLFWNIFNKSLFLSLCSRSKTIIISSFGICVGKGKVFFLSGQVWVGVGGAEDDRRSRWPPGDICSYGAAVIVFVSPSPELRHLISNWSVFFSRFYQILTNSQVRPSLSLYNTKQFENSRWNKDYQDIFHLKRFFVSNLECCCFWLAWMTAES